MIKNLDFMPYGMSHERSFRKNMIESAMLWEYFGCSLKDKLESGEETKEQTIGKH